ncbi:SusC/RagA family TonB-linked outer membrane protein [Chitinophaga japonensis]|uniref:TonB-linked SusC/RagA family outer membrane protein n=1 Tax=Chitinophaga japonensis TaxID=104662 RepID=A0A562TB49_CHIJA|nr:SusC/RagA family TonB-linked outer membrane protein [Chitinophaga japonensis]TWI90837.1 TonB-linked SusC/RagA family outer membrane protein [Chitinophaga japonensis]
MHTKLLIQRVVGILIFYVITGQCAGAAYAQNMLAKAATGNVWHARPLEEVLLQLESMHHVKFSYNSSILHGKTVNESTGRKIEKASLQTELPQLLQPLGLTCEQVYGNYYVIRNIAPAGAQQQVTVSGTVTDAANGTPLPGVTVMVKGKTKGTTTDATGHFILRELAPAEVLVFSLVGYKPMEMAVTGQTTINVALQLDVSGLNEVVVTALGITKEKKSLGYAVQEVKGGDLTQAREPNLIGSLTGRVAGLTIKSSTDLFQDAQISLRGQKPLIVIDGVPDQQADMWKINPDDVESINVLKGPTASALYGSIGQYGAIMITTKRGKGKELAVEFNSSTMFQPSFIRIPEVQTTYGNGYKGKYAYVDGSGGGTEGSGWIWGPKLDQPDASTPSGYWETPQYNSPIDPATGERLPLPWISRGKDNVPNFFRTGIISTNNISVTKGSDKGNFRASASHIFQQGVVPNTGLNNSSFSLAGNYNLSDRLNVDARITYNRQYTDNYPEVGYGPANYLYNLVLWTGADVDIRDLRNYWQPGQEGLQQKHYNQSWYNNPYFQAYELKTGYYKDNTFGSMALQYQFNQDFSAKFRTGINTYGLTKNTREPKSYIRYSDKSRGNFYVNSENYFDIVSDLLLRYEHTFTKDFSVHAELGGSNYYRNNRYQASNTDGLTIPGFYNLGNSTNPVQGTNGLEERRTSSVYGFVDMEFLGAFYLSLTGRNDKISTLPVSNNSFFYPSVSGSVLVSELARMPQWLSYLKLRGSWSKVSSGLLDNDDPYTYNYLAAYDRGIKWNGTPSLTFGGTLQNPDLQPRTSNSWEAGLELRLFGNRVGFDATYYRIRDYNNIVNISVSGASGYTSRKENGNEYLRKGMEFVLTASPVRNSKFSWDVLVNFSSYRRYLEAIFNNEDRLGKLKAGDRMDRIFTSVYEKDPEGNIVYQSNGFPKPDPFSRFIGNDDPDWVYGVENTFRYGNFSLRFLVDGRIGGLIYSTTNQKMWWGGTHPGTVNQFRDDANAGQATYVGQGVMVTGGDIQYDGEGNIIADSRKFAPNTQAVNYIDYMVNTSNAAYTNYNYYSETFLKLREVNLSWQLPKKWMERSFFRSASVALIGRNLLLFAKLPNVDPDPGVDNLQTPSMRSMGVNMNLKF